MRRAVPIVTGVLAVAVATAAAAQPPASGPAARTASGSDNAALAPSELYRVAPPRVDEPYMRRPLWVQNPQLAIKMTYLLSR